MIKNFELKIKNWLKKLQDLPEQQKKTILWTIVIIVGLIMGIFWIKSASESLSTIGESIGSIEFPEVNLPEMPSLDNVLQDSPATNSVLQNLGGQTTPSDQEIIK